MKRSIKLEGKSLEAARKYVVMLDKFAKESDEIVREQQAKLAEAITRVNVQVKQLWMQMVETHGIDAEKTWITREWSLDYSYIKHHDTAFLNQQDNAAENEQGPLANMQIPDKAN